MRIDYIRITLVLALILGAVPAFGQNEPQMITIPLSKPGEQLTLEIGMLSARIEVIGEDRADAEFAVTVEDGERKIVTPSGTKSLKGGSYELEVEEEDNYITVDTDWRANKVTVVARIPRNADLDLSTTEDGEIIVSNISGNLRLENINGPITATNISGSVIAESVNEDIDVSFTSIDGSSAMSFASINGDLTIGLPAKAGAQFHIDSDRGEIFSDFEVEVEPTKPVIEREDDRGGVSVRIESVIVANVNGGGPVIKLKTLNGDIQIRKSGN